MKKTFKAICVALCAVITLGSAAGCAQNGSAAAKGEKVKIGVIQYATHPSLDNCYNGFVKGLEEAGYKAGENIEIDFQNAMGQMETSDQLAKTMASKGYDLVVGIATPSAISAYSAARGTEVPVVFCAVSDPIAAGLAASYEAPGENCTGTSDLLNLEAQLKLIRALQPDAKKIGILYTTSEANSVSQLAEIKKLAPDYGFEIVEQGVQSGADIPQAAATLVTKVDCVNNFTDNNVVDNLAVLLQQADAAGIPVYGSEIEQVKNGCLASESLDYVALGVETAKLAVKVLGGEKAGGIAISRVKDSTPVINKTVLAKLGLTIPAEYAKAETVE